MSKAWLEIPEDLAGFLEAEHCDDFPIDKYFITQNQREIMRGILVNQQLADEMLSRKLQYLNTTLLFGKTGTGKTTFGRFMAYTLDLDFVYINFAQLVDGMFGNTSRNISKIFRFMADKDCIFMLDEIDCIAVRRSVEGSTTGGELSRITITLMQELDYLRKMKVKSIILAATNRIDTLDEALISRFSLVKEIGKITNQEKQAYIEQYLKNANVEYDVQNIEYYCAANNNITQRNMESDMNRCIAEALFRKLEERKKLLKEGVTLPDLSTISDIGFVLNHVRE